MDVLGDIDGRADLPHRHPPHKRVVTEHWREISLKTQAERRDQLRSSVQMQQTLIGNDAENAAVKDCGDLPPPGSRLQEGA
jgi:hypothetical protein